MNKSNQPVSLGNWVLRDRNNKIWDLSSLGTLAAGGSATITRNGQPMSLNNAGDEICLIDASGNERDRFAYASSNEGEEISTGH
jgi:hypothetical protein